MLDLALCSGHFCSPRRRYLEFVLHKCMYVCRIYCGKNTYIYIYIYIYKQVKNGIIYQSLKKIMLLTVAFLRFVSLKKPNNCGE